MKVTGVPATAVSGTVAEHPGSIDTWREEEAEPLALVTIALTVYVAPNGKPAGSVNR